MTDFQRWQLMAKEENRLARKRWDDVRNPAGEGGVKAEIKQYLGTGISIGEAARRIGCTRSAASKVLSKQGWKL